MCLAPNLLPDGVLVACRKCELCRQNIVNDWTGRCIAQHKTSNYTYFATLTYGPDEDGDSDHIRAAVLTYSDFQKYAKRLRKTIGKFKYLVVGEYGKKKGRAHWHALLFTDKPITGVKFDQNIEQKDWPHGFTMMRQFNVAHARYCSKYVFKDQSDDLSTSMLQMSKKPPIGHEYFRQLAARYVANGIAPQNLKYSFRDVRNEKGVPYKYMMRNQTAENFIQAYTDQWENKHGRTIPTYWDHLLGKYDHLTGTPMPASELLDKYVGRRVQKEADRAQYRQGQRILDIIRENHGITSHIARFFVSETAENEFTAYCLRTGAILTKSSSFEKVTDNAQRIAADLDRWSRFHKPINEA